MPHMRQWQMKLPLLLCCLLLTLGFLVPENVYRFPLDEHTTLAGTFGELRSNHFHSGIDIKTGGRTGAPIYAIQDGYVSRIKVSPYGFGLGVYLRHPDGRYSVYAHMDRFNQTIEARVWAAQLQSQTYDQELYLPAGEIPVRRGELLGYSGNSGSSLGPHLHFELRDPEERIMNPLIHYRDKVVDRIPPTVQEIGFEPIDPDSRVRGEFRKLILPPAGSNGNYEISTLIKVQGRIGIEYRGYDLLDGAPNHCGINHVRLFLDGTQIYAFDLEVFSFDESRYINQHIDYGYFQQHNKRFEKAYQDFGNEFSAIGATRDRGMIVLQDDAVHHFRLELADGYGNTSTLSGRLQRDDARDPLATRPAPAAFPKISHEIRRNVLVITAQNPPQHYREGLSYTTRYGDVRLLPPAYTQGSNMVFLLPLERHRYPARFQDESSRLDLRLNLQEEISPYKNNLVELDELQLYFPYESLYAPLHIEVSQEPGTADMYSDVFTVGNDRVPVFKPYLVSFVPNRPLNREQLVVAKKGKGKWEYAGNSLGEDGNVYAAMREFGTFCLMADTEPPFAAPVNFSAGKGIPLSQKTLKIRIDDTFSGIDSDRIFCTIDGKWAMFAYDFKTKHITHEFSRPLTKGEHVLELTLYDKARNLRRERYTLNFY